MATPGGLARGLRTGVGIYTTLEQNKRANKQAEQQDDLHQMNMALKKLNLEGLKDEQVRKQTQRDLQANLHFLRSLKDRDDDYFKSVQENPEQAQYVNQAMQRFGSMLAQTRGADNRNRKFKRWVPTKTKDGKVGFVGQLEVDDPERGTYEAPMTKGGGSNPDDPVKVFSLPEIAENMVELDSIVQAYEDALIRSGDMTPVQREQALRAAKSERQQAVETREDEQQHDIRMQGLKNKGRRGGGATQGDIQLMNYFQTRPGPDGKPVASNAAEARELVRSMKTDPNKMIVDIANTLYENEISTRREPFEQYIQQARGYVEGLTRQRQDSMRGGGQGGAQPGGLGGGAATPGQFEEGKVYEDASGNKARYINGRWEPVQ